MTAFLDGWLRGMLGGTTCFLGGLIAAEVGRFAGLPDWMTFSLGIWAFLVTFALLPGRFKP